tara:strand:- start:356 stop:775 length:420 start_codon:yes stop_codon:yes gene_type:complete
MNKLEILVASITALILFYIIIPKEKPTTKQEEIIEEIPAIEAWIDTHEKWNGKIGNIVKIKFLVESPRTKLWVIDMAGRIVHELPFFVSPLPNKPSRVYGHVWKLYESERTQYILPGEYEIIVGTHLKSSNNYRLDITI